MLTGDSEKIECSFILVSEPHHSVTEFARAEPVLLVTGGFAARATAAALKIEHQSGSTLRSRYIETIYMNSYRGISNFRDIIGTYTTQCNNRRIGVSILNRKNIESNPLLETYKEYIEKIDTALNNELELYLESEFMEPLKYAVDGGKRIRPIILLLAAECVGKIDENTLSGACAIELLHTESVIHDDIIDNETKRRQKDPFHIKFGYNTSVLTGDFVLGLILNISSRLDNPRITKLSLIHI